MLTRLGREKQDNTHRQEDPNPKLSKTRSKHFCSCSDEKDSRTHRCHTLSNQCNRNNCMFPALCPFAAAFQVLYETVPHFPLSNTPLCSRHHREPFCKDLVLKYSTHIIPLCCLQEFRSAPLTSCHST